MLFQGQLVILISPGAQYNGLPRGHWTLNNDQSTGDNTSGATGDTEFPWGTITIDFPGGTEH